MDRGAVRLVQSRLTDMGHFSGEINGIRDDATHSSVRSGMGDLPGASPLGWAGWSTKRQVILFLQRLCHSEDLDAGQLDGWWGPQTAWAADALAEKLATGAVHAWRDVALIEANPHGWPHMSKLTEFYGPRGAPDTPPAPPPLVRVRCPWLLRDAWNKSQVRTHFEVHEKVADSLRLVLREIRKTYSTREIEDLGFDIFGGDYTARKMRGGTQWSTHSWGVAIDFDPERNQLNWSRTRARLAHPDCEAFWQAWETQGWVSLGRSRNFDWMHVQAARL